MCLEAEGACHDRDPEDLEDFEEVGLVGTEVGTSLSFASVTLDTRAPRLHGTWRLVEFASFPTGSTVVTGTMLSIDEHAHAATDGADNFSEDFSGAVPFPDDAGTLSCEGSGLVSGTLRSSYTLVDGEDAEGTLTVLPSSGSTTYNCTDLTTGATLSGAIAGVYSLAYTDLSGDGSPFAPLSFEVDADNLLLLATPVEGTYSGLAFTRVSDDP